MNGMQFDAGTWWLIALAAAALIGTVGFFLKRTIGRVDKCEHDLAECVKKDEFTREVKELNAAIRDIKEDYITKEDFYREQSKTDRKLDRITDILMDLQRRGEPHHD